MQRQEAVDLKFKNAFYAYFAINRYKEDQLQLKHNINIYFNLLGCFSYITLVAMPLASRFGPKEMMGSTNLPPS